MSDNLTPIQNYFDEKIQAHGSSPQGADWNSIEAQELRFEQLLKVVPSNLESFSLLDYGSGYGALIDYLRKKSFPFSKYYGYDFLQSMVDKGKQLYPDKNIYFSSSINEFPQADFTIASGVFNIRLDNSYEKWTEYTIESLQTINNLSKMGFAVNFLTKYSDKERMVDRLYYADPGFLFDYAKRHFARNVAILHDYGIYDFTLIVRKYMD